MPQVMDQPFAKSVSRVERYRRLLETVKPDDVLAILIDADPDAMASAMALKRLFWRRARRVAIFHTNVIQRADNRAFVRLLQVDMRHISEMDSAKITRWATVDAQPPHHEEFSGIVFDIVIDHHPVHPASRAVFLDIREQWGAASSIMTEYLRAAKVRPSVRLATALLYGIKTDTDDFVRKSMPNDVNAFRYLYRRANVNIVKKIESSGMTQATLASYRLAMERFRLRHDIGFIYMGEVQNPDVLVMIADFFMHLAEVNWSIAAGICERKLIVILRNARLRGDAGRTAQRLFGKWGGTAGGHRTAARAEIPLEDLPKHAREPLDPEKLLLKELKNLR